MCVRNTIPLPVSVAPTLKYYIGNIVQGLSSSFSFTITVSAYTKKKQTIALGRRIEDSTNAAEIIPCFVCVLSGRKYVWDRTLSDCCSECCRKQVSCNGLSDEWSKNIPTEF
jgi:hypothetical protein